MGYDACGSLEVLAKIQFLFGETNITNCILRFSCSLPNEDELIWMNGMGFCVFGADI